MRIHDELRGDIVILSLKGDMMGEPDTVEFRDKVKTMLDKGIKKFILDMGGVKWMNSLGLGALIAAFTSVKHHDGNMVIINVKKKVESLFMITQIIKVFKHYDNLEAAITALQ